ncbi:MAG: YbfB/YjiJ family MFS transporter, partial [Betaproteobacteria bacterium]|nr:YbfB/YjiJ family MFS transporter [Betaproteobacteria bacterium]
IRILMIAYGLQTISIILPVMTDSVALNVMGAILFGATFVGIVSLTLTLIGRHFPANPAKAMARMTLSYGVAQIFAPAMAGYIATATGSYHGALMVTAVVMVAGMALLQALMHEERRKK